MLKELKVDVRNGVSEDLEERRATYGFNELEKQPGTSVWKLILEQFDDTLVKVCECGCGWMRERGLHANTRKHTSF